MSLDTDRRAKSTRAFLDRHGLFARAPHRGTRIHSSEGARGYSTRAAVYMRHAASFLVLVLGSAITHYALAAAGPYALDGGTVMFFLATLTLAIGALATIGYANHRNEILEQVRMYVFGMMVLPGTGIALVLWMVKGLISSQANPDAFTQTLDVGLLMVFGAVLIMPPIVFLRLMAGIRTMHRTTRDDQEVMQAFSRVDGAQR